MKKIFKVHKTIAKQSIFIFLVGLLLGSVYTVYASSSSQQPYILSGRSFYNKVQLSDSGLAFAVTSGVGGSSTPYPGGTFGTQLFVDEYNGGYYYYFASTPFYYNVSNTYDLQISEMYWYNIPQRYYRGRSNHDTTYNGRLQMTLNTGLVYI
jgi:hypothetical protein